MQEGKAEHYKELHRRVTKELWENGNIEAAEEHLHPKLKGQRHAEGIDADGLKAIVAKFRDLIPDLTVNIERQVVEGNTLVTWTTIRGRHTGRGADLEPSGNEVNLKGACMTIFEGDKVIEEHVIYDQLEMANQLGVRSAEGNLFARLAS